MFDCIIIGGGVAGMTAALYLLRNNKSVLIIEKENIGGQISKTSKIENFPNIESISGEDLAMNLYNQIVNLGAQYDINEVVNITNETDHLRIKTDDDSEHLGKTIIIATGAKHRKLNIDGEDSLIGRGVYYCAICDGPFFADKEVALVGDGNSAMQYALMLSSYCSKVTMLTLTDKLFGEQKLVDKVKSIKNIHIIDNSSIIRLIGDTKLDSVVYNKKNDGLNSLQVDALFVAIGQEPDTEIFKDLVDIDDRGYIVSTEACSTKLNNVFVAGDCRTKNIRQVITAMSDGAIAATNVCKYLN